jgi:hypothetical protein
MANTAAHATGSYYMFQSKRCSNPRLCAEKGELTTGQSSRIASLTTFAAAQ